MPVTVGVSITKRFAYRSSTQEFSNVYYYRTLSTAVGDADLSALIDNIVTVERNLHSTVVSFINARCWTAGGTAASNIMRTQKTLTGVGSMPFTAAMDRERAYLVMWDAGKDIRGKPVFLRKWYHSAGAPTGFTITNSQLEQVDPLSTALRDSIAATAQALINRSGGTHTFELQAKSGRTPLGSAVCHKFLEHHQLGDQWRG